MSFANDSQVTVVGPSAPHKTLALSKDSILNTTFTLNGEVVYRIKSNTNGTKTDVLRAEGDEPIACYDRGLLSSTIVRPSEGKVKVSTWAVSSARNAELIRDGRMDGDVPPTTFTSGGDTFVWKVNMVGQMACYRAGSSITEPIAWFDKSCKRVVDGVPTTVPATMSLVDEVTIGRLRDDIVLSWLIVYEKVRAKASRIDTNLYRGVELALGGPTMT